MAKKFGVGVVSTGILSKPGVKSVLNSKSVFLGPSWFMDILSGESMNYRKIKMSDRDSNIPDLEGQIWVSLRLGCRGRTVLVQDGWYCIWLCYHNEKFLKFMFYGALSGKEEYKQCWNVINFYQIKYKADYWCYIQISFQVWDRVFLNPWTGLSKLT